MGIPEKIKHIEEDLHRTQVNKKTEHHIGLLKAKLAKLKRELEETKTHGGASPIGYDVKKKNKRGKKPSPSTVRTCPRRL